MRLSTLNEFELIARLAAGLAEAPAVPASGFVALGIGDDAAVLELEPGRQLVATSDVLVEEVHFRRAWHAPEDLGWKSLAVNVSDLGAMGAAPLAALVCLALPADLEAEWVEALYGGLRACAGEYGCPVVGGDTVASPGVIILSVTALGSVAEGRWVGRGGAGPGDGVWVTGTLGDSAAGLGLLRAGRTAASDPPYTPLFQAHLRPRPPVRAARALAEAGSVTAMLDLSDGLASDLERLRAASGVGARIDRDRLPISLLARRAAAALGADACEWPLTGGEDYEYLFTVAPEREAELPPLLARHGTTGTRIGSVAAGDLVLVGPEGEEAPLPLPAFRHFGAGKDPDLPALPVDT